MGVQTDDRREIYSYDRGRLRNRTVERQQDPAGSQTYTYRYDAEGLRSQMEENGKLVSFIYAEREVIAEEDEAGEHIRYIRGHELLASDSERARTYYHYACDEMGSITDITDCHGTVLNHYAYDAFGNRTVEEETVENRFGFAGEMLDAVTGQYYLRARFYNPVIARFLSEDTYYGDGLNLYAYGHNNPVRYVDPSGHWCEKKQNIYERLLREEGLDPANIDPETRLRLMAQASNEARGKEPGDSGPVIALPGPVDTESNRPNAPMADVPGEGGTHSLSNVEERKWYLEQEAKIPDMIDKSLSLEEQVKQAFNLRNKFRTQARELIADRKLAESLYKIDPNRTWEEMIQRQLDKGLTSDDIYKEIIASSQRSRISVNKSLGLE